MTSQVLNTRSQVLKSIALVLCVLMLFVTVLPQAQSGWGFWACLALRVARNTAFIAASMLCGLPDATIVGCVAGWATYFGLRWLYKKKC